MKKNMSVVVLVIEIAAISILHAVKIKQSVRDNHYNTSSSHYSSPDLNPKMKTSYTLVKMIK